MQNLTVAIFAIRQSHLRNPAEQSSRSSIAIFAAQ